MTGGRRRGQLFLAQKFDVMRQLANLRRQIVGKVELGRAAESAQVGMVGEHGVLRHATLGFEIVLERRDVAVEGGIGHERILQVRAHGVASESSAWSVTELEKTY